MKILSRESLLIIMYFIHIDINRCHITPKTLFLKISLDLFWIRAWPINSINMKQSIVFYAEYSMKWHDIQLFTQNKRAFIFLKSMVLRQTWLWFYQINPMFIFLQREKCLNISSTSFLYCFVCSSFVFFLLTIEFEYFSLSPHFILNNR